MSSLLQRPNHLIRALGIHAGTKALDLGAGPEPLGAEFERMASYRSKRRLFQQA